MDEQNAVQPMVVNSRDMTPISSSSSSTSSTTTQGYNANQLMNMNMAGAGGNTAAAQVQSQTANVNPNTEQEFASYGFNMDASAILDYFPDLNDPNAKDIWF
jgi:tripartite-type tricarboxylate transporter receptor subunit TctC